MKADELPPAEQVIATNRALKAAAIARQMRETLKIMRVPKAQWGAAARNMNEAGRCAAARAAGKNPPSDDTWAVVVKLMEES